MRSKPGFGYRELTLSASRKAILMVPLSPFVDRVICAGWLPLEKGWHYTHYAVLLENLPRILGVETS
jgi:hypothetical protein